MKLGANHTGRVAALCRRFHCTEEDLMEAIAVVGPAFSALQLYFEFVDKLTRLQRRQAQRHEVPSTGQAGQTA
jgi:hypothetical protein